MRLLFKFLILFFDIIKNCTIACAMAYIIGWAILISNDKWFSFINTYLHALPDFFDNLVHFQVELFGDKIPMGYVLSCILCLIVIFLCWEFVDLFNKMFYRYEEIQEENKLKKYAKKFIKKQEQKLKETNLKGFCALFEILFEDDDFTNINSQGVKIEYLKSIASKLEEKYTEIVFKVDNQIFLTCYNFSKIDTLVFDVVKLYKVFSNLAKNKNLKTNLKFAIYSNFGSLDVQKAKKRLNSINNLNFLNKIVTNNTISEFYQKSKYDKFKFQSLGIIKIINDNADLDMELFKMELK